MVLDAGKGGSAASIEGLRPYAYRCAIRLSLHKYKGKAAAEAYFQYVRVRLIPTKKRTSHKRFVDV